MASLTIGRQIVVSIIGLCVAIELALQLADWGILDNPRLRQTIYEYGGFWPGLLDNWRANYVAQPYLMFVTYGFLHGGFVHLAVNMATLWSLAAPVIRRVGARGFLLLYVGAIVGGGLGYALLSAGIRPMVGASGALFGLAGGLLAWSSVDRFTAQQGLWPIMQTVVLLIVLNVVLWFAMGGQLAWETHCGGFLSGWLIATLIDQRPRGEVS